MPSAVRKCAVAGAVAAAALAASATGAQAATASLNYSCTYLFIGAQPLSVTLSSPLPASIKAKESAGPFVVTAAIAPAGQTGVFFPLLGASTVEGSATASYKTAQAGHTVNGEIPLTFGQTAVNDVDPILLNASGSIGPLKFNAPNPAKVSITGFKLNLTTRDAEGNVVQLPGVGPDSDGNPDTFDVYCTLAPATQDTKLATINVVR